MLIVLNTALYSAILTTRKV